LTDKRTVRPTVAPCMWSGCRRWRWRNSEATRLPCPGLSHGHSGTLTGPRNTPYSERKGRPWLIAAQARTETKRQMWWVILPALRRHGRHATALTLQHIRKRRIGAT
jgi:hypothetical protein